MNNHINRQKLDLGRLARLREQLARFNCGAGLFYDPINIRYATGTSNMQVYSLHNPCRYVFVATDGPVILFEFSGCEHLSNDCAAVTEVRDAVAWYHFSAGQRVMQLASKWCREIADLVQTHGANRRLAVDRLDPIGTHLLEAENIELVDGQEVAHMARLIKTGEELKALRNAVQVCQTGIRRMQEQTRDGMTEQAIWSILHQTNIEQGGEWIETRLLSSGPRTNPWYQEVSDRVVRAGDMISLDSDMVGPLGYSADISRSWIVEDTKPTEAQRQLYSLAHEQVTQNCELFQPGRTFSEVSAMAMHLPSRFSDFEISAVAHGIGLCNEFPLIMHHRLCNTKGHEGTIMPGMVLCVESYVGEPGGLEGVKLEQQVVVTDNGWELLSDLPFDSRLL